MFVALVEPFARRIDSSGSFRWSGSFEHWWSTLRAVICPNCASENKPGRKFCVACATPLAAACPNCGASFDPGDVFCGECGTALTSNAPAARAVRTSSGSSPTTQPALAERRLVTILFADLVGFTPFAEERDAEDVRDTLTRYFEHRFGGHRPVRRHGREVHRRCRDGGLGRTDGP